MLALLLAVCLAVANPLDKRASLVHCTTEQKSMVQNALIQSSRMAQAGASAIRSGSSYGNNLFQTFFKTTDESSKSHVANILDQIAEEAQARGSGRVTYSCTPDGIPCSDSESFTVTAYGETDGYNGDIRTCPAYFSIPSFSNNCDALDQATSTTHEMAHTKGIYGIETYGYYAVQGLDSQSALINAESYAFFSKAALLHCQV
ncbi:metallo proteinase [Aspergillus steynii IBT 23096]|uniref:Neutral protease 2 n=1 Tax=Aspergillus steynii IBT 23096 TaxID=1392250 RepID=A0A2I2GMG6_9EURO|nr:metallo proteinase [Aspergillus steynii IBT 23096]PLB54067.1 metallo proteinase [Aspergillus steynii IBT 23096]